MFLKLLFCILFTITTASAAELRVRDSLKNYSLTYSSELVKFESKGMKLSLEKQSCNQDLLEKFSRQVELMQRKAIKKSKPADGDLHLISDKSTSYLAPLSMGGRFFRAIPREIKRLKVEESLRCKKKQLRSRLLKVHTTESLL